MSQDNIFSLEKHHRPLVDDPLTELIRQKARDMLAQAIEAEADAFLESYRALRDEHGRQRLVRNGYLPGREVQTGIGPVSVSVPRLRDRTPSGEASIRFTSAILPKYLRRTRSVEALIPWLYLKGISTGQFAEALAALLGTDAPNLSASTVARLNALWRAEYEAWRVRDLSDKQYAYFWVDGVYFTPRIEHERQCMLVVIAATEQGRKELLAVEDGFRESTDSWRNLLLELKARGLEIGPKLAVGDGALGFWRALLEVYGSCDQQRCWVHKTANVLNYLPESLQKKAKAHLQEIHMAETKEAAEGAFDHFVETYGAKYPKAAACLEKDRSELLVFYGYPAEHWVHLRTTNPIESTFATVRLRTAKTRGCLSRETALTMVWRLCLLAEKHWRKLNGSTHLVEVLTGTKYIDGIHPDRIAA